MTVRAAVLEGWDYSRLVARAWQWPYETDGDFGTIHLALSPDGLEWSGDTSNPQWAGYYTIGLQSFEDFLARGALPAARAPADRVDEIREYVRAYRRRGAATALTCFVRLEPWRLRKLERLTASLNGKLVFSEQNQNERMTDRRTFELFVGTVPAGEQKLTLAWATRTEHPGKLKSFARNDLAVDVRPGSQVCLCLRISDAMEVSLDLDPPTLPSNARAAPAAGASKLGPALRRILAAMAEWSSAGDARDHGAETEADRMQEHAILVVEETFLESSLRLRSALPEIWAIVEVGAARAVFDRMDLGLRAQVERLCAGED